MRTPRQEKQRKTLARSFDLSIRSLKGAKTRSLKGARGKERTRTIRFYNELIRSQEKAKAKALRSLARTQTKSGSGKPKRGRKVVVREKARGKKQVRKAKTKVPRKAKPKIVREKIFRREVHTGDLKRLSKEIERTGKRGEGTYRDEQSGFRLTNESNKEVQDALVGALPDKFLKAADTIELFGGPPKSEGQRILADWWLDYQQAPEDDKPAWPQEMSGWT